MASDQVTANETIAKALAEPTRAAIQVMAAAVAGRPQSIAGPKLGTPAMKQTSFNWEAGDKYSELKTFRLEVSNILTTYNAPQAEQLVMAKNWLGRKGLQFIELLTEAEKDRCDTLEGLLEILTDKFRPQFNEMIKSLLFHKLIRHNRENAENGWEDYDYLQYNVTIKK